MVESDAPAPEPGQMAVRFTSAVVDENHLRDFQSGTFRAAVPIAGEVLQIGANVIGWRRGQPVVAYYSGPLAEYLILPAERLIPRAQLFGPDAMLCPIALALRVLREVGELPDATAVMGAGFMGLCLVALMEDTTPWVVGSLPTALELSVELGASQSMELDGPMTAENFRSHPIELLLEASGNDTIRQLSTRLVARGGTVLFAGPGAGLTRFDCTRLHYDQLTLRGTGPLAAADLTLAEQRLGELPDRMLSGKHPLQRLPELFARMQAGEGVAYLVTNEGDLN